MRLRHRDHRAARPGWSAPVPPPVVRRLAGAITAVVLLAGCASQGSAEPTTPTPTPTVEVAGGVGVRPAITVPEGLAITETTTATLVEGEGPELVDGQAILLDYLALDVVTGETVADTFGTLPEIRVFTEEDLGTPLYELLAGQRIGSRLERVELGTPERPNPHVLVVDVRRTRAVGDVLPTDPTRPTVTLAEDGTPTVTIPEVAPPTSSSATTLIKGNGPQVSPGQSVVLQLLTVRWSDQAVLDSTWGVAPRAVAVADLPVGLAAGIVEQTVGSQVLVVVPATDGGNEEVTVYVVDILATADLTLPPAGTEGQQPSEG